MAETIRGDRYIDPPKEWKIGDQINESDLNRIEGNIKNIKTQLAIPAIKITKMKYCDTGEVILKGQFHGSISPDIDRVYLFIMKRNCKNKVSRKAWRHLVDKNLPLHTRSKNYNNRSKKVDSGENSSIYKHLDTEFLVTSREVMLNKIEDFKEILQDPRFIRKHRKRLIIGYGVVRLVNDGSVRPFNYGPISKLALSLDKDKENVCVEIR